MALYRHIGARDLLELFIISAVTGLLAVRLYLHLSGYPQLGGDSFHIAHMLWGGLLMLAAIVIAVAFLGLWARRMTALIGGLGFGIFIDEIGKFITHDNDYFYKPAVGIIYAVFVVLYILFTLITRHQKLSSREYQLNALAEMEEAISHDLDENERDHARLILTHADQKSLITIELQQLFDRLEIVPSPPPGKIAGLLARLDSMYSNFWRQRASSHLVRTFFMVEVGVILLGVLVALGRNIDDFIELVNGQAGYGTWQLIGELAAALVANMLALSGVVRLKHSRLEAFELFRMATLTNLFLTEFFRFSRLEFAAMPSFILNLILILIISFAIGQERRLRTQLRIP